MPTSCNCICPELSQALVSPCNLHFFRFLNRLLFLCGLCHCSWKFPTPGFWQSHHVHVVVLEEALCGVESEQRARIVRSPALLQQNGRSKGKPRVTGQESIEARGASRGGWTSIDRRWSNAGQLNVLFPSRGQSRFRTHGAGEAYVALSEGHRCQSRFSDCYPGIAKEEANTAVDVMRHQRQNSWPKTDWRQNIFLLTQRDFSDYSRSQHRL